MSCLRLALLGSQGKYLIPDELKKLRNFFHKIYLRHKNFWTNDRILSLVKGSCFFAIALIVQKLADSYVGDIKGVAVPDLLLDHLPTVDIDFLIIQGALVLTALIFWLMIIKPKYLIFTVNALAIFIITRSFFISLTHLGVSPRELPLDTNTFGFGLYNWLFNTKGDFFFSGHTGIPYLMAMIFWKEKIWRYIFLAVSLIFAVSVILAHIHYSIDVFAAPFMTYGIFIIALTLFPKELKLTE